MTTSITLPIADPSVIGFAFAQFKLADTNESKASGLREKLDVANTAARLARTSAYAACGRENVRLVAGGMASLKAWDVVSDALIALAAKESDTFRAGLLGKTIAQYAQSAAYLVDAGFIDTEGAIREEVSYLPTLSEAKSLKAKAVKVAGAAKKAKLSIPAYVEYRKAGDTKKKVAPLSVTKLAESFADAPAPKVPTAGESLSIDVASTMPNTTAEAIGRLVKCAADMAELVGMVLDSTLSADERTTALAAARTVRAHAASIVTKLDPPKAKPLPSTQAGDASAA